MVTVMRILEQQKGRSEKEQFRGEVESGAESGWETAKSIEALERAETFIKRTSRCRIREA